MTALQIEALHWRETKGGQFGRRKACQRRLRRLFDAGIIRRIEPLIRYSEGKKPLIYALTKAGAQILTDKLGIDPTTIDYKAHDREENWPFLQHLFDTTDLRIAFTSAAAASGLVVESWHNELELKQEGMYDVIALIDPTGETHHTAVVPDALLCLNRAGKRAFFLLEVDRRTVTVDPSNWEQRGWTRKIRTYTTYFASDAYTQRYEDHTAQVLTITTGEQRLAHLLNATQRAGGEQRFWFTTTALALQPQLLLTEKIWQRAGRAGLHSLLNREHERSSDETG